LHIAGTNPIHNKQKKKKQVEEDDEDKAFKAKQLAGAFNKHISSCNEVYIGA
jgi:hypothetical protein